MIETNTSSIDFLLASDQCPSRDFIGCNTKNWLTFFILLTDSLLDVII